VKMYCFNGFTCDARPPSKLKTGLVCTLVETDQGPVLIDTGPGLEDYADPHWMLKLYPRLFITPMDPRETAIQQVRRLGYRPEDVRHIILTHMHFDHCGGLPDFPHAAVHVHRREYAAFTGRARHWTELAYVRRHLAHKPWLNLYEEAGDQWFGFAAIRLPFEPEMWLVPLFGHSRGHCGVAIRTESGWLFHVADAAPIEFTADASELLVRMMLGLHTPRLRAFKEAHPEIRMTTGHMWLDFFEGRGAAGIP